MKILAAFPLFLFSLFSGVENPGGSLKVEITGLRSEKGQLLVSVYDMPESFPKTIGMLEQKFVGPLSGNAVLVEFTRLEIGKPYAIAVMHDEDDNGKMTKNLVGYPKEGYCFSNNIKPRFRAPQWSQCQFVLENDMQISIKMIY